MNDMNVPVFHPSMLPPDEGRPRRVFAIFDGDREGDGVPIGMLSSVDPLSEPV